MRLYPKYTFIALLSMATACAFAQTTTPEEQDPTAPRAASSPHQRQTTETQATEATTNESTDPSSSSSQHQRQATESTSTTETRTAEHDRMMKECVTAQKEKDSSMSEMQAEKACADQMKTQRPRG